jgi:hypothetical protein
MKASEYKTTDARNFTDNWIDATLAKTNLAFEKHDIETSFGARRVLSVNDADKSLSQRQSGMLPFQSKARTAFCRQYDCDVGKQRSSRQNRGD